MWTVPLVAYVPALLADTRTATLQLPPTGILTPETLMPVGAVRFTVPPHAADELPDFTLRPLGSVARRPALVTATVFPEGLERVKTRDEVPPAAIEAGLYEAEMDGAETTGIDISM
jgi:hypothetical protein